MRLSRSSMRRSMGRSGFSYESIAPFLFKSMYAAPTGRSGDLAFWSTQGLDCGEEEVDAQPPTAATIISTLTKGNFIVNVFPGIGCQPMISLFSAPAGSPCHLLLTRRRREASDEPAARAEFQRDMSAA